LKSLTPTKLRYNELRLAIMLVLTNALGLGTAFGLQLDADQVGAINAFGNSLILLGAFFLRNGHE